MRAQARAQSFGRHRKKRAQPAQARVLDLGRHPREAARAAPRSASDDQGFRPVARVVAQQTGGARRPRGKRAPVARGAPPRAAAWTPPRGFAPLQRRTCVARPSASARRRAVCASSADPGRRPWSTTRPRARPPRVRAQRPANSARHRLSAPPESATTISGAVSKGSNTAMRRANSSSESGAAPATWRRRQGSRRGRFRRPACRATAPAHPRVRRAVSRRWRRRLRSAPAPPTTCPV